MIANWLIFACAMLQYMGAGYGMYAGHPWKIITIMVLAGCLNLVMSTMR